MSPSESNCAFNTLSMDIETGIRESAKDLGYDQINRRKRVYGLGSQTLLVSLPRGSGSQD